LAGGEEFEALRGAGIDYEIVRDQRGAGAARREFR